MNWSKWRLGLEVSPLGPYFDTIAVPISNYFYGQKYDHVTVDLSDTSMSHVIEATPPTTTSECVRFVVISDTHWKHHVMTIPAGDVLVHCGDIFLKGGSESDFNAFLTFFSSLPHTTKIFVGGNHDLALEKFGKSKIKELCEPLNIIYLENDYIEIEGFRIFGTPFSYLSKSNNSAFQAQSDEHIRDIVQAGFHDGAMDILISHQALNWAPCSLNLCGHVHARRGVRKKEGRVVINAAVCDGRFRPLNTPILVDIPRVR